MGANLRKKTTLFCICTLVLSLALFIIPSSSGEVPPGNLLRPERQPELGSPSARGGSRRQRDGPAR